jgi:hypothetical protein
MANVLLGMPGRNLHMDHQIFPPENDTKFSVLMFLGLRRLHLTFPEELRDWGFIGGSIDSLKYSCTQSESDWAYVSAIFN